MAVAPQLPRAKASTNRGKQASTAYILVLVMLIAGGLLFSSILLLDTPEGGNGRASLVSGIAVRLRSWTGFGSLGSMSPADRVATLLLLRAQGSAVDAMSAAEGAELLLAGLLALPGDAESREAVRRAAPLVRALSSGGDEPSSGTPHHVPSLFLLALCRQWGAFNTSARRFLQGAVEDTVQHLESRVSRLGTFDARGMSGGHHSDALGSKPLLVSSLVQVQVMAALRCSGSLLLPSLSEEGGGQLASEAFAAAERLRRGLSGLHLSFQEAGDGEGPFDVGSTLPAAPAPSKSPLEAGGMRRVRKLTSLLPMMLLFLDDGDVSQETLGQIATASLSLSSPVGVSLWAQPVPGASPAALQSWRVSPLEQAVIVAGAVKHMLRSALRAKGGAEDEGSADAEWAAADGLLLLVDAAMRCAAPLAVLEREALERSQETLNGILHLIKAGGASTSGPATASAEFAFAHNLELLAGGTLTPSAFQALQASASLEDVLKPQQNSPEAVEPLLTAIQGQVFLSATIHALTFPEFLTPLWEGDEPFVPRSAPPPMLSALLGKLAQGGALGLRLLGVRRGVGSEATPMASPTPPLFYSSLNSTTFLFYPPKGLKVLRHETFTGRASMQEHVVLTVPSSRNQRAQQPEAGAFFYSAEHSMGGGEEGVLGLKEILASNVLQVRGDGMTLSLGTSASAIFFRKLYEEAIRWHRAVKDAEAKGGMGGAATGSYGAGSPIPEVGAGASGRLSSLLAASKRLAASMGKNIVAAAAWPIKRLRSTRSALASTPITSKAMLMYLCSGAADVTLMARGFAWAPASLLERFRGLSVAELEEAPRQGIGSGGAKEGGKAVRDSLTPPAAPYIHTGEENATAEALGHAVENKGGRDDAFIKRLTEAAESRLNANLPVASAAAADVFARPSTDFPSPPLTAAGASPSNSPPVSAPLAAPSRAANATKLPLAPQPPFGPKLPINITAGSGKVHVGNPLESLGHAKEEAVDGAFGFGLIQKAHKRSPLASAASFVNISRVYARLCGTLLQKPVGAPEPVWSTCCRSGEGGLHALLPTSAIGSDSILPEAALPTFSCTVTDAGSTASSKDLHHQAVAVNLPCSRAEDDYCDCSADGADEYTTDACSAVPDTFFYCASGALRVSDGDLVKVVASGLIESNYIPAIKVRDGTKDCWDGEDEY
jgi:hypothetical protein